MRGLTVDVRREHVRFDLVTFYGRRVPRMVDGVEHRHQRRGLFVPPGQREGLRRPYRAVGVLPAVLAHTGGVGLDVAGIDIGLVERRGQELDDSEILTHELLPYGIQSRPVALGVADAGDSGPALRQ